jgi:hypothetical protein
MLTATKIKGNPEKAEAEGFCCGREWKLGSAEREIFQNVVFEKKSKRQVCPLFRR